MPFECPPVLAYKSPAVYWVFEYCSANVHSRAHFINRRLGQTAEIGYCLAPVKIEEVVEVISAALKKAPFKQKLGLKPSW